MVRNIKQIKIENLLGWASMALLLFLTFGTLVIILLKSHNNFQFTSMDFKVIKFTLYQAFVSTLISSILGIFLARALIRQSFWGKSLLITILGAPFILPTVVAILGIISIFGRNGFLNNILEPLGFKTLSIYGLHGIIIANIFFNLPLVSRLILQGWQNIPTEQFRLAESLNFSRKNLFFLIELPMLKSRIPGIFAVVFLICISSFSIALTLGGGPKSTTIELAIYQAFRFDFDLSKAANLAVFQFIFCLLLTIIVLWKQKNEPFQVAYDRAIQRWDVNKRSFIDWPVICTSSVFLIAPLLMVVIDGALAIQFLNKVILVSLIKSIFVALGSVVICLSITFFIGNVVASNHTSSKVKWFMEGTGYFVIATSPLVIGTGLFISLYPLLDPTRFVLPITALVNAIMALPFSLRIILPNLQKINQDYSKLSESLGLKGLDKFFKLIAPRLRKEIGFAGGLIGAMSMGDLGIVTLFSSPDSGTLPLIIYRLMGSYQMEAAKAAALILLITCFAIFLLADRLGKSNARSE